MVSREPRMNARASDKELYQYGLKAARRAPQFSKR